jgi:hypothetical protein
MDYIANALRNFALANGYLPYPAKIVNGRSSGESVASPQDESAWIGGAKSEYIYGAIPYTTINIPEHIVHTNHRCIEYIVNPTLCSRGTNPKHQDMSARDKPQICHIPPGDPRIHIDRYKNPKDKLDLIYQKTENICYAHPATEISNKEHHKQLLRTDLYSSISCVRGYMQEGDPSYKGYVTCWDLASNEDYKEPAIRLPDGIKYTAQEIKYNVIDGSVAKFSSSSSWQSQFRQHLLGHMLKFIFEADQPEKPTIKNVFAFAIAPPKSIRIDNDNVYHIGSTRYRILSRADILGPLFGGIYYVLC